MDTPLDFVIVDYELLLQHLDRIQAIRLLLLRQHDLTEVTLPEHSKEVEVVEANLSPPHRWSLLLLHHHLLWRGGQRRLPVCGGHAGWHALRRTHREGSLLWHLWRWRHVLGHRDVCV